MSVDIYICKLERPTKDEISHIVYLNDYDEKESNFKNDDGYSLERFTADSPKIAKLPKKLLAQKMLLRRETDDERLYRFLGFPEKSISENKIHITKIYGTRIYYSDGEIERDIWDEEARRFDYFVKTPCVILKTKRLYDSSDYSVYCYEREALRRLKSFCSDFDSCRYERITNDMLAKAEIPFLIYERNKNKCYIYISE